MKALNCVPFLACALATLPSVAFAASTSTTYNSGILVLAFVAFCALIVAVQLIPAIMVLAGALKAMLSGKPAVEHARE